MMVNKMACKSHQDHSIIANVTGQLWIGFLGSKESFRRPFLAFHQGGLCPILHGMPSFHSSCRLAVDGNVPPQCFLKYVYKVVPGPFLKGPVLAVIRDSCIKRTNMNIYSVNMHCEFYCILTPES